MQDASRLAESSVAPEIERRPPVTRADHSLKHHGSNMSDESSPTFPLTSPAQLARAGILPVRRGPVRFAVGPPNGVTSNSWKLWAGKNGDVYIACRDNFKEAKVSLHASGRWRMGFTTEALTKSPNLPLGGRDRAWEVWDKPPPTLPNTTIAFRLVFPT